MQIRRRNPCLIEISDELVPNIAMLLQGSMQLDTTVQIAMLCPLGGQRISLAPDEVLFLARLTAHGWHRVSDEAACGPLTADGILDLAARGALVTDTDAPADVALREGEARLDTIGWHPLAAVYHAMSRWQGVIGDAGSRDHGDEAHRERLVANAEKHGPLAPHFPRRTDALSQHLLPLDPLEDTFAQVLRARRTTRHFDQSRELPLADFSRVLRATFGAMGTQELAPGMVAIRRTSASGGALHPIEAYPLVIKAEGLTPGFYHYESGRHALALLLAMSEAEARAQAVALTIGQTYFAEAHALVFHVARLDRHHWKYRRHPKAYKAVLLDSGHLSQTFYLLAAERNLGAFYTAAINDGDLGTRLGLDPLLEFAIGANGLGVIDGTRSQMHLHPAPHIPDRL